MFGLSKVLEKKTRRKIELLKYNCLFDTIIVILMNTRYLLTIERFKNRFTQPPKREAICPDPY